MSRIEIRFDNSPVPWDKTLPRFAPQLLMNGVRIDRGCDIDIEGTREIVWAADDPDPRIRELGLDRAGPVTFTLRAGGRRLLVTEQPPMRIDRGRGEMSFVWPDVEVTV